MPDAIVFLQVEHLGLSRLLDLLDLHGRQIARGEEPDHAFLGLVFEYFLDFPDACHHPKEDLVFRRLQRRDPVGTAELGDLLGDHRQLEEVTRHTAETVERARQGHGPSSESLAETIEAFVRTYRSHLEAEDRHFFPRAAARLTREDWDLVDFSLFDRTDPLFRENRERRFAALRERIWATVTPREDRAQE